MPTPRAQEVTALLRAWNRGEDQALEQLFPLMHAELYRAACRCLAHAGPVPSLQPQELISELYLRVPGMERINWRDRGHFLAICTRQMRWILTDAYRSNVAGKRGMEKVALDEGAVAVKPNSSLWAMNLALQRLADLDARKSHVVELRFFVGLSVKETAEALEISPETVMRDWKLAKAWLFAELGGKKRDR